MIVSILNSSPEIDRAALYTTTPAPPSEHGECSRYDVRRGNRQKLTFSVPATLGRTDTPGFLWHRRRFTRTVYQLLYIIIIWSSIKPRVLFTPRSRRRKRRSGGKRNASVEKLDWLTGFSTEAFLYFQARKIDTRVRVHREKKHFSIIVAIIIQVYHSGRPTVVVNQKKKKKSKRVSDKTKTHTMYCCIVK